MRCKMMSDEKKQEGGDNRVVILKEGECESERVEGRGGKNRVQG